MASVSYRHIGILLKNVCFFGHKLFVLGTFSFPAGGPPVRLRFDRIPTIARWRQRSVMVGPLPLHFFPKKNIFSKKSNIFFKKNVPFIQKMEFLFSNRMRFRSFDPVQAVTSRGRVHFDASFYGGNGKNETERIKNNGAESF